MTQYILLFLVGLALLIVGAELLVRGASRLSQVLGLSRVVIGLTVVAFGTSAPELTVSVSAALAGQASIAIGNVIGSNIFNVLFILGVSAMITPLLVSNQLVRIDVPLVLACSVLMWLLALDRSFSVSDGLILCTGLILYISFLLVQSRANRPPSDTTTATESSSWIRSTVLIVIGVGMLVLGSKWLVTSAVHFTTTLGISQSVIALTLIAAGTSLPEAVTSIVAALKGERDIAVANVLGSNIFNIMGVLGLSSLLAPNNIAVSIELIHFDIPVMIVVAFACLPIFFTGNKISRSEGALLFAYYVAYTLYLVMAEAHHAALAAYSTALFYFVLPLTLIALLFTAWQQQRGAAK